MAVAWIDRRAPATDATEMRTFGRPLMPDGVSWPVCGRCKVPFLFRAQLPLALTTLVAFTDERMLLVFECHSGTGCGDGAVLVAGGDLSPRSPPDAGSTVLPFARAGELVPYEDGLSRPTTLPPLEGVPIGPRQRLRALVGGNGTGGSMAEGPCACGRPERTALTLLGDPDPDAAGIRLRPARVTLCVGCGRGRLLRPA